MTFRLSPASKQIVLQQLHGWVSRWVRKSYNCILGRYDIASSCTTGCIVGEVVFRRCNYCRWEQEKRLNVEKFSIVRLQVQLKVQFLEEGIYKCSNLWSNLQLKCFFQVQAILELVRKIENPFVFGVIPCDWLFFFFNLLRCITRISHTTVFIILI